MICFIKGCLWTITSWFKTGQVDYTISGHIMKTKEIHENCSVEISYCEDCGKQEITWTHGKFSDRHKNMMYEKGNCHCLSKN